MCPKNWSTNDISISCCPNTHRCWRHLCHTCQSDVGTGDTTVWQWSV